MPKFMFKTRLRAMVVICALVVLSGCSTNPEQKSVLDRIEFGEDEYGCARIAGTFDTSASIFASANASVSVVKKKDHPDGGTTPDC